MTSPQGERLVAYLQEAIRAIQDEGIDPGLPADEYKIASIGKWEAQRALRKAIRPFTDFKSADVKANLKKDNLYYTHTPKGSVL